MAQHQSKVHFNVPPICLRIRGPSVYEDENRRTWLHLVMETGGVLQVRLRQEDVPSGHISLTTSPLTSSTMPSMWMIHPGNQYVDPMFRSWRIVQYVKVNGVDEMTLELMEDK